MLNLRIQARRVVPVWCLEVRSKELGPQMAWVFQKALVIKRGNGKSSIVPLKPPFIGDLWLLSNATLVYRRVVGIKKLKRIKL